MFRHTEPLFFLAVKKLYKKVGDEVVLKPGTIPVKPPIIWKEGNNIAMQWDGMETDSYRQFLGIPEPSASFKRASFKCFD